MAWAAAETEAQERLTERRNRKDDKVNRRRENLRRKRTRSTGRKQRKRDGHGQRDERRIERAHAEHVAGEAEVSLFLSDVYFRSYSHARLPLDIPLPPRR